jgi:hypothetical protein
VAHLERFAGVVGTAAARPGGLPDLLQGRLDLRTLLDELNPTPLGLPGRPAPQDRRPPPGPDSDPFPDRVQVVALDGRVLAGSPMSAGRGGTGPVVERPVRVNGEVVALARMRPKPLVRDGGEARFLHDQYRVTRLAARADGAAHGGLAGAPLDAPTGRRARRRAAPGPWRIDGASAGRA